MGRMNTVGGICVLATAALLSGCGGGGGGDGGSNNNNVPTNRAPTAVAGADQTVAEQTAVTLDGGGSSDLDGDTLSYSWTQTAGPSVSLGGANSVQATFTAPDVGAAGDVLTFQLSVGDGTTTAQDVVNITVQDGQTQVVVAGTVSYEWVPTRRNNSTCFGLDFPNTEQRPIRAATVQLVSGNTILGSTVAGEDGSYSFSNIDANTDVKIRIRAELKKSGAPRWDVEVRDNVDTSPSPPPLASRPLYVFESQERNTGTTDINDFDVTATTGWGTNSYTGTRAAAPFAILDTLYTGMRFVLDEDPTLVFPPLDAFWSVNNTRTDGEPTDIDIGELGGSFYRSDSSLFLMGDEDVDTGEFDYYVTLHEWGHYFEDKFSRSDSVGGTHFIGGLVEARVSFGEGWGTALGAMASGEALACNTRAANGGGWGFNVETYNGGPQGWYNEISVAGLLLDLVDTNNDGADTGSIGFGPIYDVMTDQQRTTDAFTSLFSFAAALRPTLDANGQALLDDLLAAENVETAGLDKWATTQDNINIAPNNGVDVMPLYVDLPVDGSVLNVCVNNDYDPDGDGNKPAIYRYLRITTTASASYEVRVEANPIPPATADAPDPSDPSLPRDRSDPDVSFFVDGAERVRAWSSDDDLEVFTTPFLGSGIYLADLKDWRLEDPEKASDYQTRTCFDVTMTAL